MGIRKSLQAVIQTEPYLVSCHKSINACKIFSTCLIQYQYCSINSRIGATQFKQPDENKVSKHVLPYNERLPLSQEAERTFVFTTASGRAVTEQQNHKITGSEMHICLCA